MKTFKARMTFLSVILFVLMLYISPHFLHADESDAVNFRQDPSIDFRAVHLDIEKDKDAEFQIVIANPTLNGDVAVSGEVTFRVPPGMTIYSSILGGTGGTGMVQVPFTEDPIRPGKTKVFSFFARSTEVGNVAVVSKIAYWPNSDMSLDNSVTRNFPINVKEPSELEGLPDDVQQEIDNSGSVSLSGLDKKLSDNDNPFGWSNWFLFLVASFVGLFGILILIIFYRLVRAKIG